MNEPRHSAWQAWIAASGFVLLILFAFVLKRPGPEPAALPARPAPPPAPSARPSPVAPPPLDRAALIAAGHRAASAWATGAPPADGGLVGRSFTLRIPFSCAGPSAPDALAPMGWRYDAEAQTLRIRVAPQTFTDTKLLQAIAGTAEFETAEGFWIDRPWILSDACPTPPPPEPAPAPEEAAPPDEAEAAEAEAEAGEEPAEAPTPAPPRQTLGLVELSAPGAPRARRRDGQAYQLVRKIAPDALRAEQGFRLVVEGRIEALPGQGALACHADRRDVPPRCLIFARIARVAIENGATGERLAEWE